MIAHALYGESSTSSVFAFYTFPCPMEDLALGFSIIFKVPLEPGACLCSHFSIVSKPISLQWTDPNKKANCIGLPSNAISWMRMIHI